MAQVHELINSDNAEKIAEEIVEIFKAQADSETVEYEFTIKERTGAISDDMANTFFYFDTKEDSTLDNFKKALFNNDLAEIEENSEEEEQLMTDVNVFLQNICRRMSHFHKEDLQEVVRRVVLGNKAQTNTIPLNTIEILSIDMADFSSVPEPSKYLLKIQKMPGTEIDVDEITIYVQKKEEEGQSISATLAIEKQVGNPIFQNVMSLEKGRKFLNEVSLFIFVDYSFEEEKEENVVDIRI
jgi:hypothetical protein